MKNKLAIVAVLSLFSAAAWAGTSSMDNMQTKAKSQFEQLDRNHDGYISKTEAKADATLSKDWKVADANGDGKVGQGEFAQFEMKTAPPAAGPAPKK